ncbi:NAD(P)-dependent oxidoreductase, partial [Actinomyces sp. MRS3W]|uniref:NAD(P)-dependent oxidoreductase n=1 Tax=Actinomyces sp. MRS3W TaxID=2800796 RepID=UPI0028FD667D
MTTSTALAALSGARVGVVGLGRTGLAVIEVLTALGARVSAFDSRPAAVEALPAALGTDTAASLLTMAGDDAQVAAAIADADLRLLIVSPGVPATGPVLT